jgi:hypothetical protein
MTYIELPRALEDYFAFAEIDPTRNGRRFSISLPYFNGDKLDRLQWWYHLSRDQEQRGGDTILLTLRAQATQRFRTHIERWLQNTGQCLYGEDPIPRIRSITAPRETSAPIAPVAAALVNESVPAAPAEEPVVPWAGDRVANG